MKVKAETNMESEDIKMYICVECGRIMENYSSWTEPHGEDICGCSYCGGAVEEAEECAICGEYHSKEDLTNGVCKFCYEGQFDYEIALQYLVEKKMLRHFFLVWYWQVASDVTDDENQEFDNTLISIFNAKVQEDEQTFRTAFYSQLKDYILDDIYDWTEFLQEEVNG
jgi:methionyl-tRNA synthetase